MRRLLVLSVGILALVLAACGGDEEASPGVSPGESPAAAAEGPPPVSEEGTVTSSGLRIIDIKVGTGEEAVSGKLVTVHYTGWLPDGSKLDSSLDRGQPFPFPLGGGQVIKGWDEGVVGMKVGGERRLVIPADLAYGAAGRSPRVPPNAELTFDIELLAVE